MAAENDFVVRVRGLPFSASVEEVTSFFAMCHIANGKEGIHFTFLREGRPSGEAFVELESEEDCEKAIEKHNDHMGKRYIEVFKSNKAEMSHVLERQGHWPYGRHGPNGRYGSRGPGAAGGEIGNDGVLRLRGLPFGTTVQQVTDFFSDFETVEGGIAIPPDAMGRPGGEAYVQFSSQEQADVAMGKDKEKIGHRYIELFKSSLAELQAASSGRSASMPRGGMRPSPYDRMGGGGYGRSGPMKGGGMGDWGGYGGFGGGFGTYPGMGFNSQTGHSVHMRGLPFRATESDIMTFFSPLAPSAIHIHYEASGRAAGEADVEFEDHASATKAMEKDKQHMQHRYVELFLQSTEESDPYESVGGPIAQPTSMLGKYGANGAAGAGGPMPLMGKGMGAARGGMGGGYGAGMGYGYGAGMGGGYGMGGGMGAGMGAPRGGGSMLGGAKKPMGRGGAGGAGAYGGDMSSVPWSYGSGDYGGW